MSATLAHFDPISLAELVDTAAMMTRVDRKYLLHRTELSSLLAQLPAQTRVLDIEGIREHRYATTYFDTADLLSYRMTAQKRRRRFKVRTRTYLDSELAFCEVKCAGPRGKTVKHRKEIPTDNPDTLPEAIQPWLSTELMGLGQGRGIVDKLGPVVWNSYRRTTFLQPGEGRATVDTDLRWRSFAGQELSGEDLVFIETKSGARPSTIDRLLWSQHHRPTRVSKFGTGMAAMHQELPSNKWTPVLKKYFPKG